MKSHQLVICISKTRQDTKIEMMKLYDDCLIFILEKNLCTDRLPTTIQNDIFTLRKFYQVTLTWTEKAEILEYCAFSHSLWWEDKLENIGTVCLEWDDCVACYRWNEIEEEKKTGGVYLEKLSEELTKAKDEVKDASMKFPSYLSHLTSRITSIHRNPLKFCK